MLGNEELPAASANATIPVSAFTVGESDQTVGLRDLLFFDLETTGLGGAGTVPFLAGCGSLTKSGFEVRQYLLPDYPDERAMLEDLALEMTPDKTLVTYNGAAFDLTLIRERFIINRTDREIETEQHIDLLHTTRRLFRRRLKDCSLVNIERELFGYYRQDDIPGYLIPSVYFDWLSQETVDGIRDVLEHNRFDILSLYFLLLRIVSVFAGDGANLSDADDVYSLSRLYGRRKRNDKVVAILGDIEDRFAVEAEPDILLYQAQALKRANRWNEALALWKRAARRRSREGFQANIELAKYYEHRGKDLPAALRHALRAERLCPDSRVQREYVLKRLRRLKRKANS
jgi:uncharacterized protein YprB with RNaseH-like and TPR domain